MSSLTTVPSLTHQPNTYNIAILVDATRSSQHAVYQLSNSMLIQSTTSRLEFLLLHVACIQEGTPFQLRDQKDYESIYAPCINILVREKAIGKRIYESQVKYHSIVSTTNKIKDVVDSVCWYVSRNPIDLVVCGKHIKDVEQSEDISPNSNNGPFAWCRNIFGGTKESLTEAILKSLDIPLMVIPHVNKDHGATNQIIAELVHKKPAAANVAPTSLSETDNKVTNNTNASQTEDADNTSNKSYRKED